MSATQAKGDCFDGRGGLAVTETRKIAAILAAERSTGHASELCLRLARYRSLKKASAWRSKSRGLSIFN
jgi:hypothetical protein